jgi:hypothetical protein
MPGRTLASSGIEEPTRATTVIEISDDSDLDPDDRECPLKQPRGASSGGKVSQ